MSNCVITFMTINLKKAKNLKTARVFPDSKVINCPTFARFHNKVRQNSDKKCLNSALLQSLGSRKKRSVKNLKNARLYFNKHRF